MAEGQRPAHWWRTRPERRLEGNYNPADTTVAMRPGLGASRHFALLVQHPSHNYSRASRVEVIDPRAPTSGQLTFIRTEEAAADGNGSKPRSGIVFSTKDIQIHTSPQVRTFRITTKDGYVWEEQVIGKGVIVSKIIS